MVDTDIATIVHQRAAEFSFELSRTVIFVGLAGAAKVKQMKIMLLTPLQGVPDQQLAGSIRRESTVRAGVPVNDPPFVQ